MSELTNISAVENESFDSLLNRLRLQHLTENDESIQERLQRDLKLIARIKDKAQEQRKIIDQKIDRHEIFHALSAFKNLQQIRLMRNYDADDRAWQGRHLSYGPGFAPIDWTLACQYTTEVLSDAIEQSNSNVSRFSSRLMALPTPMVLSQGLRSNISQFVVRLQSLEIQFADRNNNLDAEMRDLSPLLHTVFEGAVGLQCVHVGL